MRPSEGGAHASSAFLLHGARTDHHFQADEINKSGKLQGAHVPQSRQADACEEAPRS
ncbi:unnamed protein product [Trichogramma brassicae]|uniref:Uncharacterized protein n=1 Tax=Trichogramma brassicae TaxID=86971 RepID=A0A6H5I2G9_9HYME|nr:unnamed protein product [Trichogramma brassicae]